jgi:hypothetical protein
MELKSATLLNTLAGLMITFAGFSALVGRPAGRWCEIAIA